MIGSQIEGKTALIFDDMISTGSSICGAAQVMHEAGAKAVESRVHTEVVTAQPNASAPKRPASDRAKNSSPSQTASQSSVSLRFMYDS